MTVQQQQQQQQQSRTLLQSTTLSNAAEPLVWLTFLLGFLLLQITSNWFLSLSEDDGGFGGINIGSLLLLFVIDCRACFINPSPVSRPEEEEEDTDNDDDNDDNNDKQVLWRIPLPDKPSASDPSGIFMSLLLTPLLCLAISSSVVTTTEYALWQLYGMFILILCYSTWEGFCGKQNLALLSLLVVSLTVGFEDSNTRTALLILIIAWLSIYHSMETVLPTSFYGVFTQGEWMLVTNLTSIAMTQYISLSLNTATPQKQQEPTYATIAMSGILSVLITCPIMELIKKIPFAKLVVPRGHQLCPNQQELLTLFLQLPFWIGLPLLGVEGLEFYWLRQSSSAALLLPTWVEQNLTIPLWCIPKSLLWLVDFLMEKETPIISTSIPSIPRYGWLIYWIIVLSITLMFAPTHEQQQQQQQGEQPVVSNNNGRVVLMRKWFHGIAVLLFAPVTLAAPKLLSLSYAVAWAILILLESARSSLPLIAEFHERYLDSSKDALEAGGLVVSHMALIVGCALPLWIAELLPPPSDDGHHQILLIALLQLWGVLCLGIGDAMGALVGVLMGRIRWSPSNSRTIEGSLAMWISLVVSCWLFTLYIGEDFAASTTIWQPCLATITFVTLLEAHTFQIDNLVLPLAGAASLLLLATTTAATTTTTTTVEVVAR